VVGFAAETEALERHARAKLAAKGADMIAGNRVDQPGTGFESDDNALLVVWAGGERAFGRAPKTELAERLLDLVAARLESGDGARVRQA
jgi:phosphopantothenoylcysteine decarboxylase / phosphopantothenate---cysteine ligase